MWPAFCDQVYSYGPHSTDPTQWTPLNGPHSMDSIVCVQVQASGPLTDAHQSALEVISKVFSTEAAAGSGGSGDLGTSHMDSAPYQGFNQRGRGQGSGGKANHTPTPAPSNHTHTPTPAPSIPALACLPAVSFVAKTMPDGLCVICLNAAVVQAMWTCYAEMTSSSLQDASHTGHVVDNDIEHLHRCMTVHICSGLAGHVRISTSITLLCRKRPFWVTCGYRS